MAGNPHPRNPYAQSTRHRWRVLPAALILLAVAAGCGGDSSSTGGRDTAGNGPAADCPIQLDTGAWDAFVALGNRITAGETVTKEDLEAYADEPVMVRWRATQAPPPPPVRIGNWLAATFETELGTTVGRKHNTDRFMLKRNYRYSYDNRDEIQELIRALADGGKCTIDSLNRYWIDPGLVSAPLIVNILPALAEVRTDSGQVFVDTGVLLAGGVDQATRQVSALLYRNLMAVPGLNPLETDGELAIGSSCRVLMNEAIGSWIEQSPYTHFRENHPSLARVVIIPETFFQRTIDTMRMFAAVGPMLDDPVLMAEKGRSLPRSLFASGALSQAGFGMAAVIAAHLGPDRLRQAGRSVPEFFAAFQEAALLNPVPTPVPGTAGAPLSASVPAFEPAMFAKLHALLVRLFPQ